VVNPAPVPNAAPTANAGSNRSITLPTNSTSLSGSGADTDGTITSYRWSQVSGPNTATIATTTAASTGVSNLIEGTYVFRLTVTDNDGARDADDVTVTVNPAPVAAVKRAPVSNA
ncbi:PKD domain-containing protein, partial [Flavihumibacter sediminis]|nr:PKD domain-containing protein [Flavihumibacter sediminis]